MRIASLSLLALCLTLAAVPAMADVYNNGPINGNTDAWTINSGFVVSDSFRFNGKEASVIGLTFATWMFPGDVLTSVEVSITTQEFGGSTLFDGVISIAQSGCVTNQFGFNVCTESGSFNTFLGGSETYWLNLQNASVANGDPVYWDENSGPSLASESSLGTIPSEAFTIRGDNIGGTTPEPHSILLFGSAILGLAGVVRRKLLP